MDILFNIILGLQDLIPDFAPKTTADKADKEF